MDLVDIIDAGGAEDEEEEEDDDELEEIKEEKKTKSSNKKQYKEDLFDVSGGDYDHDGEKYVNDVVNRITGGGSSSKKQ